MPQHFLPSYWQRKLTFGKNFTTKCFKSNKNEDIEAKLDFSSESDNNVVYRDSHINLCDL